ncbi:CD59 glycoprotein [Dasypus novemcinctus]|uniref:CD59 glycoprotein n=1 Tax=Dasypus novemcinctus TaxID=9361 RepID=UPI00265F0E83|nr:CD59 glycoprotein [Dasypus novemcinctus]
MGSKGRLVVLGLLLVLAVLCHSGSSLQCYSCLSVPSKCNMASNCSINLDACLWVKAGPRNYYQCWKFSDCNFKFLSQALGEKELSYECCQRNLCNGHGGLTLPGKTFLLVASLLATWNVYL